MKTILVLIVLLMFLVLIVGCSESPTEVTVEDSNEDFVYHIGPDDGLLGNVDLYIFLETMQGVSVLLINGPGNPIGYQIRKDDIIYCQDSYIGSGGNTFQSGTSLPFNTWVNVNLVVYKSTFVGWLWPIADLWDVLYDAIVDATYEIEVMIVYESGRETMYVRSNDETITVPIQSINDFNQNVQTIIRDYLNQK